MKTRLAILPPLVAAALTAAGCSVNPATGQRQLVLLSESQEIALGRQSDEQIVASMGLYGDAAAQRYVAELGAGLAAVSERPDLPWTFRVIDDPVVNAFALPGGYVYVTRGIMAHFNSEAELVSVLGHEIGHVTARHGVERLSKAQLATVGIGIAAIASEDFRDWAGLAQQGLGLLFLKFSRDDERQADDLGLRYLVRGRYDPREMPRVFNTLDRLGEVSGQRLPGWLSTHPAPANRAERIAEQVAALSPDEAGGKVERDAYLARLDGMPYGADPREGYAVGSTFYHPGMAFVLDFPPGWEVVNQRQLVGATSPGQDAVVVLTLAPGAASPEAAMQDFFAQQGLERGDAWGERFRYFRTQPRQGSTSRLAGLVGFVRHRDAVFRLLSYTSDDRWSGYGDPFKQSLRSFRNLTQRRYLDVEPKRVDVVRLDRAMTLAEFHRRYPSTVELGALAILNGVAEGDRLPAGTRVKRVVGGELPRPFPSSS
jgi:predicted Zn-dependent protease